MSEHFLSEWVDWHIKPFDFHRVHIHKQEGQIRWRYEFKGPNGLRENKPWTPGEPYQGWFDLIPGYKKTKPKIPTYSSKQGLSDENIDLAETAKKIDKILRTLNTPEASPERPWLTKPETQNNKKQKEKWKTVND